MSAETAVLAGRVAAQRRMTSRATVRRKTDATTTVNRMEVPVWAAIHTGVPFRLDGSGTSDGGTRSVTLGGVTYETATGVGHFPASTSDLADDDLIDVVSGEWAGAVYRVVKAVRKDQATARRVPIVEATRPEEWA